RLAKFKMPRSIDVVDELPRQANGTLVKRTLKEPYWADAGRRPGACPGRPGSAEADQLADIAGVDDVGDEPGRVAGDPARGCGARGRGPEAEIVEAAGHGLGGVGLADGDAGVDGVLDPTAFTECDGNASTRVEDVAGGDGVGHLVGGL